MSSIRREINGPTNLFPDRKINLLVGTRVVFIYVLTSTSMTDESRPKDVNGTTVG